MRISEKTIVKDSAGTVYPYAVWREMIEQDYEIRPVDITNENTEFRLYRLSEKERAAREKRKADLVEKGPRPRESAYFKTGEKLKFFKAKDLEGNKIEPQHLEGKILVLNFWFINCSPCRKEIPDLNALVDSFASDSVVFLAIAPDSEENLLGFLKMIPFKYDIIYNGKYIIDKYRVMSFPTHVIVNRDGTVYFHTSGLAPHTVPWIKKSIKELLDERKRNTNSLDEQTMN